MSPDKYAHPPMGNRAPIIMSALNVAKEHDWNAYQLGRGTTKIGASVVTLTGMESVDC